MNTTPTWRDLTRYFIPLYAVDWKRLGTQLSVPTEELKDIETNFDLRVEDRCREMLQLWFITDPNPSWKSLISAAESLSLSTSDEEGIFVCIWNSPLYI